MKKITLMLILMASVSLTACDTGKEDTKKDIKYDLSTEYGVPISDIDIEEIEYGISVFTTNQFKVTINGKGLSFYLVEKGNSGDNFRRIPIEE